MSETIKLQHATFATQCIMFAYGLMFPCIAVIIPYMKTKLALDDAQLGTLLFFFGVGGLITTPPTGVLIKRLGTRTVSLFSGLIIALTLPFMVSVATSVSFGIWAFFFGIARNALNIAINSQAVTVEKKLSTPLMSHFHFLFSSGGIFGGIIISFLLKMSLDIFWCIFCVSLLLASIFWFKSKRMLPLNDEIDAEQKEKSFTFPGIKLFLLGVICFIPFVSEGVILNWSGDFLRTEKGYDLSVAGMGYAIFSISMALGRFMGDRLKQQFGFTLVFQASALLCAAGFMMSVYLSIPYGPFLGFFFIGLGAANLVPIIITTAGNADESHSSVSLAFVTTVGGVIAMFGPTVVGYIAEVTSLGFAFTCIGGLVAMLVLCGPLIKTKVTETLAKSSAG